MSAPRALHALPDSVCVGLLLAVARRQLGGVALCGMPSLERDDWLAWFRGLLPEGTPWRKAPVNVTGDRLLGGIDVAATLQSGTPVLAEGLLAAADQGVVLVAMAERLPAGICAAIAAAMDVGHVNVERDGFARKLLTQFSVVALDESVDDDAGISSTLADRLAFRLTTEDMAELPSPPWAAADVEEARTMLARVTVPDAVFQALVHTAEAIGAESARGALLASRAARAAAALEGRLEVNDPDAELAARLVLACRATRLPAEPEQAERESAADDPDDATGEPPPDQTELEDIVLEAVRAALPPGLLEAIQAGRPVAATSTGRFGPDTRANKGRPVGTKNASTWRGERVNVLATLKAAAPWQTIRARDSATDDRRLQIRAQDLRTTRFKEHCGMTTLFVVDASGSQAAQRLGEVKGAIELLLSQCYVRRDHVAMIAFRGEGAELVLPPTRALARARRLLAGMPGGGATPLATGIDLAREVVETIRRQGRIPAVVFLTDGRSNVARDGSTGRAVATADTRHAAGLFRSVCPGAIVVDTSRRPRQSARELAQWLAATYLPLPHADASSISTAVAARVAA